MTSLQPLAPPLQVSRWFNTAVPIDLYSLRGRVVIVECFQMLCPGCVSHGLPQAARIHDGFNADTVAVIGLHTVFEHHDAMQPHALEVYLNEYGISFPVGVDTPGENTDLPRTMQAYQIGGTPTLILIDKQGRRRAQYLGAVADLRLGAEISALCLEDPNDPLTSGPIGMPAARRDGTDRQTTSAG